MANDDPAFNEAMAEALRLRDEGAFDPEAFRRTHPTHADAVIEEVSFLDRLDSGRVTDLGESVADETIGLGVTRPRDAVRRLGDYDLEAEIGRGGQGVVYRAVDRRLGRRVALKVLNEVSVGSMSMRRRLQREAEAASRLDHPGICAVYDLGESDGIPFIAMRFVEGESLAARLEKQREARRETPAATSTSQDELRAAIRLVGRIARALHVAHEAGLIHRDIKPANVIVTAEDEPVILDFGLARDETGDQPALTLSGQLMGTPAYMAPEQIAAERISVDRRADVYALGVMLFECLTLKLPFEAPTRDQLYHQIMVVDAPDPTKLNRAIPRDLKVVLETALDKNRDRRYQTAAAFADDLDRVIRFEPIQARPAGPLVRAHRFAKRRPAAAALLAVTLVGLPVLGWMGGYIVSNLEVTEAGRAKLREDRIEGALEEGFMLASARDGAAVERFGEVLELAPGHVEAIAGSVVTLLRLDQYEKALALLDREAVVVAEEPALQRLRARVLRWLDRYDEAGAIERALPPPEHAIDHFLLGLDSATTGRNQQQTGPYARALRHFEQAAFLSARRVRMLYFLEIAKVAVSAGEPNTARRIAAALTHNWPERRLAWHAAGLALTGVDNERAVECFDKALALDDQSGYLHHDRAAALRARGDHEAAVSGYERAVELEPRIPHLWGNLALAYGRVGRRDDAKRAFRAGLEIDPEHGDLLHYLGTMLAEDGEEREAIALLERATKGASTVDARNQLGLTYYNAGRVDDAIRVYRSALQVVPRDTRLLSNLGLAYDSKGENDRARECYEKVLAIEPRHVKARTNLGTVHLEHGRYRDALREFDTVIEHEPNFYNGMYNRAVALWSMNRADDALKQLAVLSERHPERGQAWGYRGRILISEGRPAEGIKALRTAIRLGHAASRSLLASTLVERGEYEAAIDLYREMADLEPDRASPRLELARTLRLNGETTAAIGVYQKIAERWPAELDAYLGLAEVYRKRNEAKKARAALQRAEATVAVTASSQFAIGGAYLDLKEYDAAVRHYRRAIELDPKDPRALCNLGHALNRAGRPEEALAYFRRGHYLGVKEKGWEYPSRTWFRSAEKAVLQGLRRALDADPDPKNDARATDLLAAIVDGFTIDWTADGGDTTESRALALRLRRDPSITKLRARTKTLAVWPRLDALFE